MTHSRYRPLTQEALDILDGVREMPDGRTLKVKQFDAVCSGDDAALALWSRLRWRWLVSQGRAEIALTRAYDKQSPYDMTERGWTANAPTQAAATASPPTESETPAAAVVVGRVLA
jgi:hypothetical protein